VPVVVLVLRQVRQDQVVVVLLTQTVQPTRAGARAVELEQQPPDLQAVPVL
jgi:hypothetical protein